ncbi:MAG: cysteine synthase A [Thermodesulfobacteriota bacterium]
MLMYVDSILDLIGDTSVVKLQNVVSNECAAVWAKLENLNPAGSIKERITIRMLEDAEQRGLISPDKTTIIEPTSGNTGIGMAFVCAVKGYKLILTMPDNMSLERKQILAAFRVKLVLTDKKLEISGAIDKANEILKYIPDGFMPQQFTNKANTEVHSNITGVEIIEQIPGKVDAFVAGVGTGGTLTGIGKTLRKRYPDVRIYAVEPEESPVLSGGTPGNHGIQGIGIGFIPQILDTTIYDDVIKVKTEDAIAFTRQLASKEGILVGISSGASGYGAVKIAKYLGPGKNIVTIFSDSGERYLTTGLFDRN